MSTARPLANPISQDVAQLPLPRLLSNWLEAAWQRSLLPAPSLSAPELVRAAGGAGAGGEWREGLERLSTELRARDELSAFGRTIAHGQLVKLIRQRARAEQLWRAKPEIRNVPLAAPVIILGHMRSGTTRLHRLLACDDRFAYTRFHESMAPVGRSPLVAAATAGAIRLLLSTCNPQLRKIHPMSPNVPEEEFGLHAFSFHGAMFEAQWRVPQFARWCEQRDLRPVYREFRSLLQTLAWRRRDPPGKVQLLKAPQFMQDLHEVLAAFPDARILHLRRDMQQVIASSASLVWNQQRIQSPDPDRGWAGREWRRKTEFREQRAQDALRGFTGPLLQIDYEAMNRDWRAEIGRIYDFLGFRPLAAAERRMRAVANDRSHCGHQYSAALFGLDQPGRPISDICRP